jgi:putative aldouronate transport system permease protein
MTDQVVAAGSGEGQAQRRDDAGETSAGATVTSPPVDVEEPEPVVSASAVADVAAGGALPVQRVAGPLPPNRRSLRVRFRRDWPLLAMTIPAGIVVLLFHYLPTLGNIIAFQDYNPWVGDNSFEAFIASEWIGFGNFEALFRSPAFWDSLVNTLTILVFQLIFYFPLPIFIAIVLHSLLSSRLRGFIQSVIYLPHFFSWVLVVTFFVQTLGGAGVIAQEMRQVGLQPYNIMTNPDVFIFLVTAEVIWKDVGWGTIVFLAALSAIDTSLYESAASDGAGRWRRLWHVTLPGLRPVIVLLLILRLGDALNVGFEQFILQRDAVGREAAEVLDTFVYYNGIVTSQYGYGAAAGVFKALVGIVLILIANKVAHRLGEAGLYQSR